MQAAVIQGACRARLGLPSPAQQLVAARILTERAGPVPAEKAPQVHRHEEDAGSLWVQSAQVAVEQVLVQQDINCASTQAP